MSLPNIPADLGWGGSHLDRKLKEILDGICSEITSIAAATAGVRSYKIQLAGRSPTKVVFGDDIAAEIIGTETATFTLQHNYTLIVTVDTNERTATFEATAGKHTGDTGAATDLTSETDTKFKIKADGESAYSTVTCDWTDCDTGAEIATEMQTKIQALGGAYASVTVTFDTDHYIITSGTKGSASAILIDNADDHDVCDELKIGDAGTDTAGTGDAANIAAATLAEVLDVLNADLTGATASDDGSGHIKIVSDTEGATSSLVIGAGTGNTALGFTQSDEDYGAAGLDEPDMADANYEVVAMLSGTAQASIADKGLSVTNKATTGFELECETAAATDYVDLAIIGTSAS